MLGQRHPLEPGATSPRPPLPLQRPLLPSVEKAHAQCHHEEQALHETEHTQVAVDHGPRDEEDSFDVEDDEEDPNNVGLFRESPFLTPTRRGSWSGNRLNTPSQIAPCRFHWHPDILFPNLELSFQVHEIPVKHE